MTKERQHQSPINMGTNQQAGTREKTNYETEPGNQTAQVQGIKAGQMQSKRIGRKGSGKKLPSPQKNRIEKVGTTTSNSFASLNTAEAGESLEITR